MDSNLLRHSIAVLVLGVMALGPVAGQDVRVAVLGDPSLADLVDVTTAALSGNPGFVVLERADLDKLGQEQALQSLVTTKDLAAASLLPAEGLVLLRAADQDGKAGVFARLVAVQPGVVLREVALPAGTDAAAQAAVLKNEFSPYWSKLGAIQKGKIRALSLLGLRFEVDAPETREFERSFNILLASRLSAEPDVLVLERWRLNDAAFEKALTPQQPSAFWTGSSLIDGSMKWDKNTGLISVSLRLQPSHGTDVTLSDEDTPDHLAALVGRLADKIDSHPLAGDAWKPSSEAAHYAELGQWCLDNHLLEEGTEALDSALALGDDSRTTHMLQVKAYAMEAYPDDLRVFNTDYNKVDVNITFDSLPQRLAAAARTASLARDYVKANQGFSSQMWTLEDPYDLSAPVLNNCLRVLRAAYENDFQRDHGDEVAEARHEVQKLIVQMKIFSPERHVYFLIYCIRYAGLWHETPEETLTFYRDLLNRKEGGAKIRTELFKGGLMEPYLDGEEEPAETAPWSVKSPWIVGWDGRSDADLKTVWQNFVKELAASPDPVAQADSLKFEFASNRTALARDEVLTRTVAFLKQHPEDIYGPRGEDFVAGFSPSLSWAAGRPENAAAWNDLANLYMDLFHQHETLPSGWIFNLSVIVNSLKPTEAVKNLLSALNDYVQWYQAQSAKDSQVIEALTRARQTIYNSKPELTPVVAPVAGALYAHQAWNNQDKLNVVGDSKRTLPVIINFRTLICAENKLWFMAVGEPPQVMGLDTANWQIISSDVIPAQFEPPKHSPLEARSRYIAVTPQWLVFAYAGQVLLCSRTDHQWRALDLPPSTYKPKWVNQELYLLYEAEYGAILSRLHPNGAASVGSGLIRVSLPDGKIENLISSRRIPPENSLDGKSLGQPSDLWMSYAGLTLALDGNIPHFQVYASPVGKNDWISVTTDIMPCLIRPAADGVVMGHRISFQTFNEITLINKKGNEVLLANPDAASTNGPVKPVWNFPDELRSTPSGERFQIGFAMRGDDLCLCHSTIGNTGVADNAGDATLYYFAKGQAEGIKIPLAFDLSQIKGSGSIAVGNPEVTDTALIFSGTQGAWQGFWAIPWSDIDAYRAKVLPVPAVPSAKAAAAMR